MSENVCSHISAITELKLPQEKVCTECVKIGSNWMHLRTCQTCGVTLCCDNSPMKHMTAHNRHSGHPVIISAEPGERWFWCFPDEQFVEY